MHGRITLTLTGPLMPRLSPPPLRVDTPAGGCTSIPRQYLLCHKRVMCSTPLAVSLTRSVFMIEFQLPQQLTSARSEYMHTKGMWAPRNASRMIPTTMPAA